VPTYDLAAVDPAARNSSQALELELVGRDRTVLDVGCATGYLARALAEQGCTVTGIEYDAESAELARPSLEDLVIADLNTTDIADLLPGRTFDSIVFGDVLEHLQDPDRVLRSATGLLAPGGSVVISVPNVTHGSIRLSVLQGRWQYTESGLLDRTHVRFFTRESALAMVREAGLVVTDLYATVLDPLGVEIEIDDDALPWGIVDWVRRQPDAYVYQFVMRATLGSEWTEPELVPAVDLPHVEDVHAERAEFEARLHAGTDGRSDLVAELLDARHRLLTLRDHAVGAEATVMAARRDVARARAEAAHERAEKERLVAEIKESATWRVGSTVVAPASKVVRRLLGGAHR
jgi:2-polyprenyl-3-methyl-5-hydroxy-6-metoxy-1,4-benzoquinol methylase